MRPVFTVLAASVTTFAATNLDDLFLLTFFVQCVSTRRIVAGQYFGFAAIVIVSLAGVWAAGAAIPQSWIRLLGIFPLAIGVKELVQLHDSKSIRAAERNGSLSVFSIAVITLANGQHWSIRAVLLRQPIAPLGSSGHIWAVGSRVVCRRQMDWKPPAYSEGARPLGSLDWAVRVDRAGRSKLIVISTRRLPEQKACRPSAFP
jgi:hypothetical protein